MARTQWAPTPPGDVFKVSQPLARWLQQLLQGINRIPAMEAGTTAAIFPDRVRCEYLEILDNAVGGTVPSGYCRLWVDASDGDLKITFSNGVTKTITTDSP